MRYGLLLAMLLISLSALARVEVHDFDSPEQEATYKQLINELRCLVCQNQNLADSNAELALDLRRQAYEMLKGGASKEDVIDYMVQRYGDFVLYRPPLKRSTLLLWVGPFIILGTGVLVLVLYIRRRRKEPGSQLTPEQQERARRLLNENKS